MSLKYCIAYILYFPVRLTLQTVTYIVSHVYRSWRCSLPMRPGPIQTRRQNCCMTSFRLEAGFSCFHTASS
jgi:hypothetical protein